MPDLLVWLSTIGILFMASCRTIQRRQVGPVLWTALILAIVLGTFVSTRLVRLPWHAEPAPRGTSPAALTLLLYVAMLTGMFAHYLYSYVNRPRAKRGRFDVGTLIAPILVSPIIFLPLASVLQSLAVPYALPDPSRFALALVAFENGFFWRELFANRKKARSDGGHP